MTYATPSIKPFASETNGIRHEPLAPGFFREGPRALFACHHLPETSQTGVDAIVLCNATGHEYERGHRALRQLAAQLARAGHHAMRFDYFGTGDSAGEYNQASLTQWQNDVTDAIGECRRFSGCERVSVIGLRLGATLAMQAAAARDDVMSLVLWDPVIDDARLLAQWQEVQSEHDRRLGRKTGSGPLDEVLGFALTASVRAELNALAIPPPAPSLRRVLVLPGRGNEEHVQRISPILGSRGARVDEVPADASAIWRQEPMEAIVPFKLLRRIVAWLGEEQG